MAVTTTENLKAIVREDIERVWKEGDLSCVDEHYSDDSMLHVTYQSEEIHSPVG